MGAGQALGVQVGAGRACVLGEQGARVAGHAGRWGGRRWGSQGERACWRASGRASGRRGRAGGRGRRLGGRALGAGRTGNWEQARGACAAGVGSVRGIGRQGARLGAPGALVGPVGGSCTRLDFQTGFSTRYFS